MRKRKQLKPSQLLLKQLHRETRGGENLTAKEGLAVLYIVLLYFQIYHLKTTSVVSKVPKFSNFLKSFLL